MGSGGPPYFRTVADRPAPERAAPRRTLSVASTLIVRPPDNDDKNDPEVLLVAQRLHNGGPWLYVTNN